jgi:hypothetical protein
MNSYSLQNIIAEAFATELSEASNSEIFGVFKRIDSWSAQFGPEFKALIIEAMEAL